MWMRRNRSKGSSSVEVDYLNLCTHNVRRIEDLVNGGNLLNQRQCLDLSSKLSKTTLNIRELVVHCGSFSVLFKPALQNLYRYLEKAKLLVNQCAEEDWHVAAVFQIQNENAFREILLDIALCYNAIYEQAKSLTSEEWKVLPEDLRQHSIFLPASTSDVLLDQQDLQKRLEELVNQPRNVSLLDRFRAGRGAVKQCLARYLLLKLNYTSEQSQASTSVTASSILWSKETEPSEAWGNSSFLGGGSGASGVCKTKWMGIPCAKKEFHLQNAESSFMKEASILANLKHPCIVNFFCCGNGQEQGHRFIAMELMEKSLAHLIQGQKGAYFSLPVVVDMMVQIARGMCHPHDQRVAHRDLKPQNVVVKWLTSAHLEDHFCVKLVDFERSKTKVQVSKSNTISTPGVGTPMYRAPEVHPKAHPNGKGKAVWFKADVYSFALTCAHLLSLKTPFEGTNMNDLYKELKKGRRPELPCDCPQELVTLLRECWDINPSSRPPFVEVCTRLETFKHNFLRGFSTLDQCLQAEKLDFNMGFDFIQVKMKEQSSIQRLCVDNTDDESEDNGYESNEIDENDVVSIIPCTCGCALSLLPQPVYSSGKFWCNICGVSGDGVEYHCGTCQFDAHPHCAEIKDEVKVSFHEDPLHLLIQNYYNDNPNAICYFCEESVQNSEWVYRCKPCDLDAHALCTKYSKTIRTVGDDYNTSHNLTLGWSFRRKSRFCKRCNGDFKGYWYTCTQKSCVFDLHPFCAILPEKPLCKFDSSHRLFLIGDTRRFHCGMCGALGFSWLYRCNQCDVDLHLDCVDDMDGEEDNWNEAYEKFMLEYDTKDDRTKMRTIIELLDMSLVSSGLETSSSSSSRPHAGTMRVQPTIRRRPADLDLDAFDDANLREKVAAETEERKAKKIAAKEARQKLEAKSLEMLESLEKIVMELQSSKKMSQADVQDLAVTYKTLKRCQCMLQDKKAMHLQSKIRQRPRICLFYKWKKDINSRELLTSLRADMKGVRFAFLCEEPGHEHIEHRAEEHGVFHEMLGERLEKLQPLLASGLPIVKRALSTLAAQLTGLDSVTLPILGKGSWNLRAIHDLEKHAGKQSIEPCEDEELKWSEDCAANWILSHFDDSYVEDSDSDVEDMGSDIFGWFGLLRVRYSVTEEANFPRYSQGAVAWLCRDHLNRGIEAGILKSYPLQIYYNLGYDQQLRSS